MNIEQIRYIVEVAKCGSISGAAKKLHVSVATISQSISNFEENLGVKIFKRSRLGTAPTEKGREIIEKVYEINHKLSELEYEAKSYTSPTNSELKIVSSPSVLLTLLPRSLSTFKQIHPYIDIHIRQTTDVLDILKQNESDIGFISVNENTWIAWGNSYKKELHFDTLAQSRLCVCVSKNSSLSFKDGITPEELLDETLVLYKPTKSIYKDICWQYGKIKVLFETYNTEIIKQLVRENIGITFLSELIIKQDPHVFNGEIIPIPLVNYEKSNLTYGWVRLKKRPFSSIATKFIKNMKNLIEKKGL